MQKEEPGSKQNQRGFVEGQENLFHCENEEGLAQDAQRSCGVSIPGGSQKNIWT